MFPTLSVTVIGLLIGAAAFLLRVRQWFSMLSGLAGAWVGFGLGAVVGVTIDAVFATGIWLAVVGHAMAVLGALVAATRL